MPSHIYALGLGLERKHTVTVATSERKHIVTVATYEAERSASGPYHFTLQGHRVW